MKLQLTVIIVLLFSIPALSQSFSIKGIVKDTLNKKNLQHTSIAILRAKDSILQTFIRANESGEFEVPNLQPNKYIVLISQPDFVTFSDSVSIINQSVDVGKIILLSKAKLLTDVVVQQKIAAIRMKGDTLEFKADSFKVSANASVQDLLKRLPGITVNSKGEISTQGQTVNKVLVDGEEFFSDDPAVVTQSLRADAIDKVQVFDKKSDQAAFTGIDDGEKNKTINLQLKEDKKKGYFGKAEAGYDFDKYYTGKLLANVFKAKQKLAAYITKDNTRYESLDWDEKRNYGEDLNSTIEMSDDGGMMFTSSSGDDFSWGQGFPTSTTAGLHYSTKTNEDKHKFLGTYQYNDIAVEGSETNYTQTLLGNNNYNTSNSNKTFNSAKNRHKARLTYEWKIDSTSNLKAVVNAYKIKANTNTQTTGNSIDDANTVINNNTRTVTNNDENNNFNATLLWRKKFAKKGRTISINTDVTKASQTSTGFLFANNQYYKASNLNTLIDQQKQGEQDKTLFNSKLVYTEPLWKNTFLELNYKYENNKNDDNRTTNEKPNGSNVYSHLIDSLSNHFIFNTIAHRAGFNVKYQVKKFNATVGSDYGNVQYQLNDVKNVNNRNISFNNFLPNVKLEYKPKAQTSLSINYNGNNSNPSLQQIQPYINNINPLNVTIGNPNLQQEFKHNIGINFHQYQVLKSKSIYVSLNSTFTHNAITTSNTLDVTTGKDTTQYINTNGNYNIYGWSHYGFELFESFNINFGFSPSLMKYTNYQNGVENITKSSGYKLTIGSSYWGDKWYNYWFNFGPNFHSSISSISNQQTQYTTYDGNISGDLKSKKYKLYFNVETDITIYKKTGQFANASDIYKVNLTLKKSLDKNENWQVKLLANDIFNSNNDINRNISSNYISQTTQQVIRRFFMFSLVYNFNKNGKPNNGF